jgi:hypothetical protein
MSNNRSSKFLPPLKSIADFQTLQTMREAINSLLNGKMIGGDIIYSDSNVVYAPGTGGGKVSQFQVVSDGGDWYNCNSFDGVTAGGEIVKVAKHQELRCILPSATPAGGAYETKIIRGVTYTYTYNAVAGATADGVNVVEYTRGVTGSDSSAETDFITPCLNVGDIISAFQTTFASPADLVDVTWQALADGRAWASL